MNDLLACLEEVFSRHHVGLRQYIATQIAELRQEMNTMSNTISSQIDAANAALSASLDAIQTDVTAIAAELAGAVPSTGTSVTQTQVDALNASVARLQAVKTALDALVVPATGTHVAQDTSDSTPNGSNRADGTTRNNFFMSNFNPADRETT